MTLPPVELLGELKETATPAIAALGDEKRAEIDETIGMLTGSLEKIAEHGLRADGIVKSMLEHSRGSSGRLIVRRGKPWPLEEDCGNHPRRQKMIEYVAVP